MKFCCFFKKDRQTIFRALEMEQTKLFKVPQILNEPLIFTWEMGKKRCEDPRDGVPVNFPATVLLDWWPSAQQLETQQKQLEHCSIVPIFFCIFFSTSCAAKSPVPQLTAGGLHSTPQAPPSPFYFRSVNVFISPLNKWREKSSK